jgi:hypothetical protein
LKNKKNSSPAPDEDLDELDGIEAAWLSKRLPEQDEKSMESAEDALRAWIQLPSTRKSNPNDEPAHALHDVAFGLLASQRAKKELADFGARVAIDFDDPLSLRGFLALGATFEPAHASDSAYSAYAKSWESSVLHHCASKRRWECLLALLDTPQAQADIALCESLFQPPQKSPLRDLDPQLLIDADRKRLTEAGIDTDAHPELIEDAKSATALLFALIGGQADESERLGLSIAVSELLQGNPFFLALRLACDDGRSAMGMNPKVVNPRTLEAVDALAQSGLWKPALEAHLDTLVGMCKPENPTVCSWALSHGISPAHASKESQESLMRLVASHGLDGNSAFSAFCSDWAQQPGFADRMLEHMAQQCAWLSRRALADSADPKNHSPKAHECQWLLRDMSRLALALGAPHRGYDQASPTQIATSCAILDEATLQVLEHQPPLPWAKELKAASHALSALRLPTTPSARL